ncbi:hypothetical protein U1Q18_001821 [Sarracenia purpurea var. burkii]
MDSDVVECWAMWKGIILVKDLGIRNIHVEGDSLKVTNAINSPGEDKSVIGGIIESIKAEIALFHKSICSHVQRNGNSVAHALAKLATSLEEPIRWIGDIHPALKNLVTADIPPE